MTTTTPHDETDALGKVRVEERPRLAEGVELLGEYEDPGYREPPLMVRRPDDQLILPSVVSAAARVPLGPRGIRDDRSGSRTVP